MNAVWVAGRDLSTRWKAATIIVAVVFAMVLLGLAIYETLDLTIYDSLPDALRELLGVPMGASAQVLAYNEMLAVMGGLSVAGLAVAIGADVVAGEERSRRLSFVLSHPVSRLQAVLAKAAVLLLVLALTTLALWGTSELAAVILGVDIGEAQLGALCLALGANALFYGSLAFGIGAATGNKALAGAVAAGVLVLSWLSAGLLPLWPEYADYAETMPWFWYTDQQALVSGIDAGYLSLHLGFSALFLAVGVVAFPLRDLKSIPPRALLRRFTRTRTASTLFGVTFGRSLTLLVVITALMGLLMGLSMGPVYEAMAPALASMMETLPPEMMVMFGAGDMSTPEGFYWGQTMGMMAPAAVITMVAVAAAGLAAEERSGRLGLLLSASVPRAKALAATAATMVLYSAIVTLATALGIWGGSAMADMGLEPANIFGAAAHLFGLSLLVGGVALLVAAATGSSAAATWTAVGIGVVGHFANAMLVLSEDTEGAARFSPFHYYASAEPLEFGVDWGHVAILAAVGAVAIALAFPAFQRRDLRV